MKDFAKKIVHVVLMGFVCGAIGIGAPTVLAQETTDTTIGAHDLSSSCYEPGESVFVDADYSKDAFSDFALYYTTLSDANVPTLSTLIAHPVLYFPFEFVIPDTFPRSSTVRIWISGHNSNHNSISLAKTHFFEVSDHCRAISISGVTPYVIRQQEAIIRWNVNYQQDSFIEYGQTPDLGSKMTGVYSSQDHTTIADISNLTPDTVYYFRITTGIGSDQTQSRVYTFRTLGSDATTNTSVDQGDIRIDSIGVQYLSTSSVILSWNTNSLANSEVEYGLDSTFGSSTIDTHQATRHEIVLSGLEPNRIYFFRVKSSTEDTKTVSETERFATLETIFDDAPIMQRPTATPPQELQDMQLLINTIKTETLSVPLVFSPIKKGDTGSSVKDVQMKLQQIGLFPKDIKTTQYFGSITELAVKQFQKQKNIASTGVVDNATYGQLFPNGGTTASLPHVLFGQQSEATRQVQILLVKLGFFPPDVSPTGFFGPITQAALKLFEQYYKDQGGAVSTSSTNSLSSTQ